MASLPPVPPGPGIRHPGTLYLRFPTSLGEEYQSRARSRISSFFIHRPSTDHLQTIHRPSTDPDHLQTGSTNPYSLKPDKLLEIFDSEKFASAKRPSPCETNRNPTSFLPTTTDYHTPASVVPSGMLSQLIGTSVSSTRS
jgi:hypothetical protein